MDWDRPSPSAAGLALAALRKNRGWSQDRLASVSGKSRITLSSWENGSRVLAEEGLLELAGLMSYDPPQVQPLLMALRALVDPPQDTLFEDAPPSRPEAAVRRARQVAVRQAFDQARQLEDRLVAEARGQAVAEERRAADAQIRELLPLPPEKWVEHRPPLSWASGGNWAFVERACLQSLREAAHGAGRAVAWAHLARNSAADPDFKVQDQLIGYACSFEGYAYLAQRDFNRAEVAFGFSREYWADGKGAEALPLEPWRTLELEAALYREQDRRRFSLYLHRMALAAAPDEARPILYLSKAETLERFGKAEAALDELFLAWRLLGESAPPQRRFLLAWKLAESLSRKGRREEAIPLLAEARRLGLDLGRSSEVTRCLWVQARLDAAEGRTERAQRTYHQLLRDYGGPQRPHETAEIALEIADLYLSAGEELRGRRAIQEIGWVETTDRLPEPVREAVRKLRETAQAGKPRIASLRKALAVLRCYRPRTRP